MRRRRVIILGAGGRDFHNFNVLFRDNPEYEVIAFTATQVPGIGRGRYPPELAGKLYPHGIPIYPESELEKLIRAYGVDEVILSYSDLTYDEVGRLASRVLASGASFKLLPPRDTMLPTFKPVIAVTAVRTGSGKSTVSRAVARELLRRSLKPVPVRHPMAYGNLTKERSVQLFRSYEDLDRYGVTIEEREEYEHYIKMGLYVLAGIDYGDVLREAEGLGDVILWDGGNNDAPFFTFDYMITVADAMRAGQEVGSYPGEVNIRLCDAVIVNKVSQASKEDVERVVRNVRAVNPGAKISLADMDVVVDKPELVSGKRVAVVEDAPTVTHGGLPYGAGYVAARKYGALEVVDPRPKAVGIVREVYGKFNHLGPVLPSLGYTPAQLRDFEETISRLDVDAVLIASPADVSRLIRLDKPVVRVSWELKIVDGPSITELVDEFLARVRERITVQ